MSSCSNLFIYIRLLFHALAFKSSNGPLILKIRVNSQIRNVFACAYMAKPELKKKHLQIMPSNMSLCKLRTKILRVIRRFSLNFACARH